MEPFATSFRAPLAPGTPVEVRSRFDAQWARGFVIAGTNQQGYVLRRLSDGAILPVSFTLSDLRPAAFAGPFSR
jgi:hypothetical protein